MITRRLSLLGLTILFCAMVVPAQVQPTSRVISFSGSIPGQPDGPVALRFRLFPAETGGDRCFEETQAMVSVTTEAFSVFIGDGTTGGIPLSCFTDNQTLWVAFAMDATPDAEIGDRTPITSSGFAHFAPAAGDAATLGGLSAAAFARLAIANTFGASQTINGNVSASQYSIGSARVLSTQGGNNLFVGAGAGQANTTGGNNTAVGLQALLTNSTGTGNTASGASALNSNQGNNNTASGVSALGRNISGSNNTAIGAGADVSVGDLTNATAIGAGAIVSQSNSLVLGNNANVGIGTSRPADRLHVVGAGTAITASDGAVSTRFFSSSTFGTGYVGTLTNNSFVLRTADTDRVVIRESGNVGIGTTTPAEKLEVAGKIKSQNGRFSVVANNLIFTTSLVSWSDMPGMTMTVTTGNLPLLILVNIGSTSLSVSTGVGTFRILVDEVEKVTSAIFGGPAVNVPVGMTHLEPLSAGPHTIKVQWRVSQGNLAVPGGVTRSLIAIEQ